MDSPKSARRPGSSSASATSPRTPTKKDAAKPKTPPPPSSSLPATPRRLIQARSTMMPKTPPHPPSQPQKTIPAKVSPASLVQLQRSIKNIRVPNYSEDDEEVASKSKSKGERRYRNYRGAGGDYPRVPLECLNKGEVRQFLREGNIDFGFDDGKNGEEEEDSTETVMGPDRARFNVWKGINYDLHVLGKFKSDFEKKVRSFQRPNTAWIEMDPFCRDENGLKDELAIGEAFLLWKSKAVANWQTKDDSNKGSIGEASTSSESESDAESCCSTGSFLDSEIGSYIKSQKEKRKQGLNLPGETLYFDEEFEVIRNLHRDSVSLTNYGAMPDDKFLGKAEIFYPEMTIAEKKMLQVQPMEIMEEKGRMSSPATKKKSSKTVSAGSPRSHEKTTDENEN